LYSRVGIPFREEGISFTIHYFLFTLHFTEIFEVVEINYSASMTTRNRCTKSVGSSRGRKQLCFGETESTHRMIKNC